MRQILLIVFMLCSLPSSAAIETYEFDTPQQEALYKELIEELRCLVCQNQNLADSNAELATDLRRKTYEMVKQDQGRNEIVTYMVQRYGDFVLYRPPVKSSTLLLWIGPFVIMAIGLYVLFNMVRRQGRAPLRQLSEEEAAKANALLHGTEDREDRS